MNIFYTAVDPEVQKVLDARKQIYAADYRKDSDHAWLYKKMAWAEASAYNQARGKSASLKLSYKGGLGTAGLYESAKTSDATVQFFPKPHLDQVNVSAEGDFGSVVRIELKFTVHTLVDLDLMQPFFDIGADLVVKWGWKNAGTTPAGKDGKFQGKIYNFNYTINSYGGFDCSTSAIGPGISILGGNVKSYTNANDSDSSLTLYAAFKENNIVPAPYLPTKKDAGENIISVTSIIGKLKAESQTLINAGDHVKNGIAIQKFSRDWAEANDSSNGNRSEAQSYVYVSLARIVGEINKLIPSTTVGSIYCSGGVTKGLVPKDSSKLVSANPIEVIFPGFAKYGDTLNLQFGPYDDRMRQGDLSVILISVNWLENVFSTIGTEKSKHAKSADSTVSAFLQRIFDLIYNHSGQRFKLSLVSTPDTLKKELPEFDLVVTDVNYIDTSNVNVYEITAVTKNSIARSVSLTSKVPNEMQTAAFVSAQSTFSSQNSKSIAHVIGGNPSTIKNESLYKQSLKDSIKAIEGGITPERVVSLQTSLKSRQISSEPDFVNGSKEAIPFPLDFTVTLDGITGIIFGNTITCNYLPAIYKRPGTKMAFTVTKVSHTISNNDWITTLNTVCRIVTQDEAGSREDLEKAKIESNSSTSTTKSDLRSLWKKTTDAKNFDDYTKARIDLIKATDKFNSEKSKE